MPHAGNGIWPKHQNYAILKYKRIFNELNDLSICMKSCLHHTNKKVIIMFFKFLKTKSVIERLALDIFYLQTKFGDSRFSRSGDMVEGIEIEK